MRLQIKRKKTFSCNSFSEQIVTATFSKISHFAQVDYWRGTNFLFMLNYINIAESHYFSKRCLCAFLGYKNMWCFMKSHYLWGKCAVLWIGCSITGWP
jgi:hypothetical protein